ncbi:hypothetical protein N6H18_06740 [Reichenbachiella agarivorans]|uniref:Outer membrane protein transport protein (OMPP1/FadL/TodX) n=1 Tax=Reichenbachiella agarivorans TaxID=2979464 RepID=A0ABY6CT10_9BACT|nr:hypothetical protein [Reichenbachiella agarivorans]UXP33650.1 hypothetical protein N6H18_06740 [Reichenbachiella agarivorans]
MNNQPMSKRKVASLFAIVLMMTMSSAVAQIEDGAFGYYNDALLFSRTYYGGTARMQGIGGAQVSLGGDINSAFANPAGLGSIRKSGITVTPSLDFSNTESSYLGSQTDEFKANFNFANLGIVFSMPNKDEESKFKGGAFAITLTRKNNFHSNFTYDAYNEGEIGKTSIVDSYLDRAWGTDPDDLSGDLYDAYNQYLINPYLETDAQTGQDFTAYDKFIGDFPRQVEIVQQRGAQYEWDFSGGVNYNDVFYVGGGLGISTIRFYRESTYTESEYIYNGQPDDAIDLYSTRNSLRLNGTGVSGTLGVVARPLSILRIGAAISTPTYYGMREESSEDFLTIYNDFVIQDDSGDDITLGQFYDEYFSTSRYNLSTPWKFSTGASIFLGKMGFISADVDFLDYSQAKISSNDFRTGLDNKTIENFYQNTVNFRLGGEIRLDQFMLRAGYGYDGDPYVSSSIDNSIQRISGGLGYRNNDFFVDLSVVHTQYYTVRSPYTIYSFDDPELDISPTARINNKNLNVSVTFGFNF